MTSFPLPSPRQALAALRPVRANLLIAALCLGFLTLLDAVYSAAYNPTYTFGSPAILRPSYVVTAAFVFLATFTGRVLFPVLFTAIFTLAVLQVVTFEYFGSYILPIHFIQLAPDFLLILASLAEAYREILPILVIAALVLAGVLACMVALARQRKVVPRAALLVFAVLAGDFLGNYAYVVRNKAKLGEPAFAALYPNTNTLGVFNAYKSVRYLTTAILPDRLAGSGTPFPALPEPPVVATPDANIILIINESIRADSLSLLGYPLKTTPRLDALPGLFASSVYASGTMSRSAFAGLMNRLKYPGIGAQFLSQSNCLFRLAKANGFETSFIYAQSRRTIDTLLPFMCSDSIGFIGARDGAPADRQGFDDSIDYHLRKIDLAKRNFIVIGPNGAHTPYAKRSPEAFKVFADDYDNAIRYTDHVVAGIIDYLAQNSAKPTYVLMTSDHGQLLKGEDTRRGHGWFKGKVVRVPFLFTAVNDPDPALTAVQLQKIQSHFDISTFVLGLLGYGVQVEDPANKDIYINGSDLSGLAGHMRLQIKDGSLTTVEVVNSSDPVRDLREFQLSD